MTDSRESKSRSMDASLSGDEAPVKEEEGNEGRDVTVGWRWGGAWALAVDGWEEEAGAWFSLWLSLWNFEGLRRARLQIQRW